MRLRGLVHAAAGLAATLAASVGLGGLVQGQSWWLPSLLAATGAVLPAAWARHVFPARWLAPLAGLAGLAVSLTGLFAAEQAWAWLIPSPAAGDTLAYLLAAGVRDVGELVAPVPVTPGIAVLLAGGVGLLALLVDTVALTLAAPAVSGLALLAAYLVPAVVHPDQLNVPAFAAAAAGYLLLLAVTQPATPRPTGRVAAMTGGLAVAALGVACAAPLVVPPLPAGALPFGLGGSGGPGRPSTTVSVTNPILNLQSDLVRPDDVTVLTYTTRDPSPSYLRVVGLDEFDGSTWAPRRLQVPDSQRVDAGLPRPPGLSSDVSRTAVHTRITVPATVDQRWLPLPYVATQVSAPGTWLYDVDTRNVFSPERTTGGMTYEVTSLDLELFPDELREAGPPPEQVSAALELPDQLRRTVEGVATSVVGDAQTDYDRAVQLQDWLRDPQVFRYDERAPDGTGSSAVEDFLTRRSGFCVHFASTMAVMARALDIPARVAVGFTAGEPIGQGRWRVTTHDAHAWPELYFEGVGWVPFEPTPAARTGTAPEYTQPSTDLSAVDAPDAEPTLAPAAPRGAQDPGAAPTLGSEAGLPAAAGVSDVGLPWWGWTLGGVLVLAGAGLTPWLVRQARRRARLDTTRNGPPGRTGPARRRQQAEQAWAELRDTAVDLGLEWESGRTPRQQSAALAEQAGLVGLPEQALARLTDAVERARYAPDSHPLGDVGTDCQTVRRTLLKQASTATRARATLWPRSLRRRGRSDHRRSQEEAASLVAAADPRRQLGEHPVGVGQNPRS